MENTAEKTYRDIAVGERASFTVTVSNRMVDEFATLSGDHNPLHVDESYARETPFKGRVVHGMLIGAFFSRLVGMHLPGKYALYLSQTLAFHEPLAPGTKISIEGEVTHKTDAAKVLTIRTAARDTSGKILVSGEALVRMLK